MRNLFFVFLLGIIGIGAASCDEDCTDETNIDCPNYNPCHDAVHRQIFGLVTPLVHN